MMSKKMRFVKKNKNGVRLLPPGFRFQPTEEELLFQYLKCKVFSFQLPASIIPEINVCNYDPWDLPGNNNNYGEEEERYLFSSKEVKYRNGNRMNRITKSGYWKATGSDKRIISTSSNNNNNNNIVGIRKTLVFYHGKSPNGSRTHWIMREYRLVTTPSNSSQKYVEDLGNWVLCRIFKKKRSIESQHHMVKNKINNNVVEVANNNNNKPIFFDFMRLYDSPISSSSSSSSSCLSSDFITQM
ncbi:NAC domain-containing protein 83 [Arachis duranensis]|uniref:NAC domain-containing protein 83 n=1 Tax=Arachis duranensis TaxID=130453 RepID=A0A6P4BDA9_ARADU|nr:NAC domain-containing protein 83 [Arachis duranensis]XP_025616054.1 NAC domain-containing protein 83 isoform X1 [Arachis hypogaea]QHO32706.1 NAC domain-containing protein [Arachis hypogaea]